MNTFYTFLQKHIFYRQHPETALRYYPVIDLLKKKNWIDLQIIEVGSGSYGIAPYLKREVLGVDTKFEEPEYPLLKQINGSAVKLPFKDKSVPIVLLSDVVEHLPVKIREKSLDEAVRVAGKAVIISGPFGKDAAAQDKALVEYLKSKKRTPHHFLLEHLELGLPDVEETVAIAEKNSAVKRVSVIGEYLNLTVRSWLMKLFLSDNKLIYYFYLKGLMVLVPFLKYCNWRPCYRTILLIEVK